MDVEIKIIGREDVAQNDRQAITVETHGRRGDMYNVLKVDQVLEGDTVRFRVPGGGRLMFTMPEAENEIVYDSAQGAAIRRSQQNDPESGKADDPRLEGSGVEPREPAGRVGVRPQEPGPMTSGSIAARGEPGGVRPLQQQQPPPGSPSMKAPAPNPNPKPSDVQRFGNTPSPEEAKKKAEAEAAAKQQQQTSQGRPPGETPPLPGSTVGSPPNGNEGKK